MACLRLYLLEVSDFSQILYLEHCSLVDFTSFKYLLLWNCYVFLTLHGSGDFSAREQPEQPKSGVIVIRGW